MNGNYTIIKKLGNQKNRKFGTVYLAKNALNDALVVIKSVAKNANNSISVERLLAERKFTFNHSGLPSVVEFVDTGESVTLVTNYKEGIHLDVYWKKLNRKEQLPFLLDFFHQIKDLLATIHKQQIIHCDLKPSNILIYENLGKIQVSIIDFGLAIKSTEQNSRKLIFPLGYAAPELILNRLDLVNKTTDYFSLGIILWRLYNDKLPFSHPNPSIYTNLQLTYPLCDTNSMPKGLIRIISKLCRKPIFQKPPNKMDIKEIDLLLINCQATRYQSLIELISDMEAIKPRKRFIFF